MKILAYIRTLASRSFYCCPIGDELEQELHSHILHRADDLERSGLSRREAERQARIEFGGHGRFQEECYETLGGHAVETLVQDVRVTFRVLRKSRGFTIVAVLTLALAIGANSVAFGLLNGLILRPLNVPRAESLYGIQRVRNKTPQQSYPDYVDIRDRNRSFDGLAAYEIAEAGLDTGQNSSRVFVQLVSGNYFDVLGVQPYLGRLLHTCDERGANSAPYVVLTYAYWRNHFDEDRSVVGRVVRLNKHFYTILGVAPPGFDGTLLYLSPDLFLPLVNEQQILGTSRLDVRGVNTIAMVVGHLKTGVTPAQAVADLNAIGAYLEKTYPKEDSQMTYTLVSPGLYGNLFGPPVRASVTGLMLLAGLILLGACANLGSLFAARAADRSREVALRLALGSNRRRILQQLLTEALLLSLIGGTVGLLGSLWLLRWLSFWRPLPRFPIHIPVSPDLKVVALALVLALVSAIFCSLVPVRQVLRVDPYQVVKAGFNGISGRRITVRDLLLVVQIAICAVLVTSSLVALRGLLRSLHTSFGFEPRNAMLVNLELSMAGYSQDRIPAMQKRITDAIRAIPDVKSVGLADRLPLSQGNFSTFGVFADTTADLQLSKAAAMALRFRVSPEYFEAAQTHLLAGRAFTWHDDKNAQRIAIVNQELARKVFGSPTAAIGKVYKLREGTRIQVVGVVEDGKYNSLTEASEPVMFLPLLQWPTGSTWIVLRSPRDRQQLMTALREALQQLDAELPPSIQAWNNAMSQTLFPARMATVSLGVLSGMGIMLSITGLFGMTAYTVSKRLKELGIRFALGAQRKEVLQAALGRALQLLVWGSAAGLGLGILASRLLAAIVYQATPGDPLVLIIVVLVMALLGLVATWLPARRALALDPVKLLREE